MASRGRALTTPHHPLPTAALRIQPIAPLHEERVVRVIPERRGVVAAEVVAVVVAGVAPREVVAPALLPYDEQGAAGAVLVAHHRVRAELAVVEAVEDAVRGAVLLEAARVVARARLVQLAMVGIRAAGHVRLAVELERQIGRRSEVDPRADADRRLVEAREGVVRRVDRKSTRLNSSH